MRFTGLVSHRNRRMSMAHANRLSRGDVRRNARLDRLRRVVSGDHAVLAVDLADDTQVVVVCDHDSWVLARRTWRCRPWQLDRALRWGLAVACRHGFAGVVVACEPTGHRWRVVVEQASRLGLEAVCVQPLLVGSGPRGRGLHPGQERRQRCAADRPAHDPAALLPARAAHRGLGAASSPWQPAGRAARPGHCRPAAAAGPAGVWLAGGPGGGAPSP